MLSAMPEIDFSGDEMPWRVTLCGPPRTPYQNGKFALELTFPSDYPTAPPCLRFLTPIHHPNVDAKGTICLDLLASGTWSPHFTLPTILLGVQQLLAHPNAADALVGSIGRQFLYARAAFDREASECAARFASG